MVVTNAAVAEIAVFMSPNSRGKESVIGAGWPGRSFPTCLRDHVLCPLSLAGRPLDPLPSPELPWVIFFK
jgi:hypothetical protein